MSNGYDNDIAGDLVAKFLYAAAVTAVVLIFLPLVIPLVAIAIAGEAVAVKARFWLTYRYQWLAVLAGILIVAALVVVELLLLRQWIESGGAEQLRTRSDWLAQLGLTFGPWAIANLAAGILLLPAAWSWHRWRLAGRVRARRISDVVRQTRIETARKRAADLTAARAVGVQLDPTTGQIRGTTADVVTVPHATKDGRHAFGIITRATVKTVAEQLHDARQVRDWIDDAGRFAALPRSAAAVRVLIIAESGTGKTVLENGLILCAVEQGWPVIMIDAKGDPADAHGIVDVVRGYGYTATVAGPWNMFAGDATQVTAKLMRLMPPADGANQHYLDEIRGVLQAVQDRSPIRSADELRDRLTNPAPHVRDQYDLAMVNAPVDKMGTTAGARVLQSLLVALRPIEAHIDPEGWSYEQPHADVTVVPISPVDDAQARLGDLLMLDLRNFMASRLARGDKSPVLVIVDEFPQLVTDTSDPGDTAGSLYETARSAGVGLVLAVQSPAGLSNDEIRRRRALTSGAALVIGRSKDPEDVVKYAGTMMQMEASGAAGGQQLNSARAQHTYVIPPQDVREASDGQFWLVQGGAIATFRALPTRRVALPAAPAPEAPAGDLEEPAPTEELEQD